MKTVIKTGGTIKKQPGFTLIEVMIVVVIIGILASIAYPSYVEYTRRANRAEGRSFLLDIAARQERYFSQNNAYTTNLSNLGIGSNTSESGKYTVTIATTNGFTLTAAPTFGDPKCGSLTLNAQGTRGAGGSVSECW